MSNIEVVGLNYYPIKSCAAVEADEVNFSELGIIHDREWMLVGKNGQPLTQRVFPELALVTPSIENSTLSVTAPGMGALVVSLERDPQAEIVNVNLWKKPGAGANQGPEASAWFSDYLKRDARLLRVERPRQIKPECRVEGASETTGFADGFPMLIASASSLTALNEHLATPIAMDRFRPNIVVEGAPAYDEDYWREVQIGNLRAFVVRACARCPMPNIDQQVGVLPKERPVTNALRTTRKGVDPIGESEGEFFGQNLTHIFEPGATVKLGDQLEIINRSDIRNFQPA
jgi:uncharacterized protein YcbX